MADLPRHPLRLHRTLPARRHRRRHRTVGQLGCSTVHTQETIGLGRPTAREVIMGFQSKIVPEIILDVREVNVNFSGFKAISDLNFSIERGELRVVIGPNGAGKTTLLDVITGKTRPNSGTVLFRPDEHRTVE